MLLNSSKVIPIVKAAAIIVWVSFGFVLAQALGRGIILSLQLAQVPIGGIDPVLFRTVANIFIYALALTIIIGVPWLIKRIRTSWKELGLARIINWKDIAWATAGFAAYFVLTLLIGVVARLLIPGADYDQNQDIGFTSLFTQWQFILTFLSLVIVAPVAEELIFRGYLLGKLTRHIPKWWAIVVSAALFAVAHGQFNVALDTFALGLVLAYVRIKTGSLWASILLHAVKNGIAFYILFVNPVLL